MDQRREQERVQREHQAARCNRAEGARGARGSARGAHPYSPQRTLSLYIYTAVRDRHDLYARELADYVHHVTGMWFSEEAIGRVRRGLGFHRRRVGRPLGQADPVEQRMYKNLWERLDIQDQQVIFIDEVKSSTAR